MSFSTGLQSRRRRRDRGNASVDAQPELCAGAAGFVHRSDITAEYITYPSPKGNGEVRGYLVRPAKMTGKVAGVVVVHENRGLNPYIEDVARRVAKAGFIALAPDGLTSQGGYPATTRRAESYSRKSIRRS